jgi:hypothetical protein
MSVVDDSFGNPMRLEEEASMPLAGGIFNHGFQCGMLWGASLAAGAEVFRRFGVGAQAEATTIMVSERLMETFGKRTRNEMNCAEIIEMKINLAEMKGIFSILKFFIKGGKVGPGACFRLAAGYARDVFDTINTVLPDEPVEISSNPVSCAGLLARRMNATQIHQVMASGFAGGIGLSGGACGALGAAIWFKAMERNLAGVSKKNYFSDPVFTAIIDRFRQSTGSEFECCEIVGRKFENIEDHAAYLRDGGCSEIIEVLAGA